MHDVDVAERAEVVGGAPRRARPSRWCSTRSAYGGTGPAEGDADALDVVALREGVDQGQRLHLRAGLGRAERAGVDRDAETGDLGPGDPEGQAERGVATGRLERGRGRRPGAGGAASPPRPSFRPAVEMSERSIGRLRYVVGSSALRSPCPCARSEKSATVISSRSWADEPADDGQGVRADQRRGPGRARDRHDAQVGGGVPQAGGHLGLVQGVAQVVRGRGLPVREAQLTRRVRPERHGRHAGVAVDQRAAHCRAPTGAPGPAPR